MFHNNITNHFRETKHRNSNTSNSLSKDLNNSSCKESEDESSPSIKNSSIDYNNILNKKHKRGIIHNISTKPHALTVNQFKEPLPLSLSTLDIIAKIKATKRTLPSSKPITPLKQQRLTFPLIHHSQQQHPPSPAVQQHTITKPTVPTLSQKTLNVINQLKENRKNRFERSSITTQQSQQYEQSNSSFSLRFKYEDLLKEQRELPLPLKYKKLYNSFIDLENTINFNKTQQCSAFQLSFTNIAKSIESANQRRFTLETFAQILYVVPHFYILRWEKKENDYELIIDIPEDHDKRTENIIASFLTDKREEIDFIALQRHFNPLLKKLNHEELEQRKKVFKNILYEKVNEYHKAFLKKMNLNEQTYNPFIIKTWHHAFELDDVGDIEKFKFQPKPQGDGIGVYEKFIKYNDIKSILVNQALEENANTNEDVNSNNSNNNKDDNNPLLQYVSKEFINKLKKKEEAINMSKEIIEYSAKQNSKNEEKEKVKELICQVQNVFICNNKQSIQINDVIEKVLTSSTLIRQTYNNESLRKELFLLEKYFPEWIKIRKHSLLGTLVIIENDINIETYVLNNLNCFLERTLTLP